MNIGNEDKEKDRHGEFLVQCAEASKDHGHSSPLNVPIVFGGLLCSSMVDFCNSAFVHSACKRDDPFAFEPASYLGRNDTYSSEVTQTRGMGLKELLTSSGGSLGSGAVYSSSYCNEDERITSDHCGDIEDSFYFCDDTPDIDQSISADLFGREGCSGYHELLKKAWTVLFQNQDIAANALSYYGYENRIAAVLTLISGGVGLWGSVSVQCVPDSDSWNARATPFINRIQIKINDFLETYQSYFESVEGQPKKEACIACDLAALLFHEICHLALISMWDEELEDESVWSKLGAAFWWLFDSNISLENWNSYRLENYFRYYIMRRYAVLGFWRCNWFVDSGDGVYNWDILLCDGTYHALGRWDVRGAHPCIKYVNREDLSELDESSCGDPLYISSCVSSGDIIYRGGAWHWG